MPAINCYGRLAFAAAGAVAFGVAAGRAVGVETGAATLASRLYSRLIRYWHSRDSLPIPRWYLPRAGSCRRSHRCRTCTAQFVRIIDDLFGEKILDLASFIAIA